VVLDREVRGRRHLDGVLDEGEGAAVPVEEAEEAVGVVLDLVVVGFDVDGRPGARDPDLGPLDLLPVVRIVAAWLDPGVDLDGRLVPGRDGDASFEGVDGDAAVLVQGERFVNFLDVRGLGPGGDRESQGGQTGMG